MPEDFSINQVVARIEASSDRLGTYLDELGELIRELNHQDTTPAVSAIYLEQLIQLISSPKLTSDQFHLETDVTFSKNLNMQALANLIIKIPAQVNISSLLAIFKAFQTNLNRHNNPTNDLIVQRLMRGYIESVVDGTSQKNNHHEALLLNVNPEPLSLAIKTQFNEFSLLYLQQKPYEKLATLQANIQVMRKKVGQLDHANLTPMEREICSALHETAKKTAESFSQLVVNHPQRKELVLLKIRADKLLLQSTFTHQSAALSNQDFSPHTFYFMDSQTKKDFLKNCTLGNPDEIATKVESILAKNKLNLWLSVKTAFRHPFTAGVWQAVRDARNKKSIFSATDLLQLSMVAAPEKSDTAAIIFNALGNTENRAILEHSPEIAIKLRCHLQLTYSDSQYKILQDAWPYNNDHSAADPRIIVLNILSGFHQDGILEYGRMQQPGKKELLKKTLEKLLNNEEQDGTRLFLSELLRNDKYVNALFRSELFSKNKDSVDPLLKGLYSRQRLSDPKTVELLLDKAYPNQTASVAEQMDIIVLLNLYNQQNATKKPSIKALMPQALAGTIREYAGNLIGQRTVLRAVLAADQTNVLPQLLTPENAAAVIAACEAADLEKLFTGHFNALLLFLEHAQPEHIQDNVEAIGVLLGSATIAQQQALLETIDAARVETIFLPLHEALNADDPAKKILGALLNTALKSGLDLTLAMKGIRLETIMDPQADLPDRLPKEFSNRDEKTLLEMLSKMKASSQASRAMVGGLLTGQKSGPKAAETIVNEASNHRFQMS